MLLNFLHRQLNRFVCSTQVYKNLQADLAEAYVKVNTLAGNRTELERECSTLERTMVVQKSDLRTLSDACCAARDKLATVERARDQLSKDLADIQSGKITIKDLAIRNGSMTAEFGTAVASVIANQFSAVLDGIGAENYIEMVFNDKDAPEKKVIVVLQRASGKGPHQLRQEAEADVANLRGLLDRLSK